MIDDFKALYEKDGSMTILSHIKGLRHYDGDESSFWSRYLALVALLCRSPVAHLLFTDNESGWKLSSIAYEDSGAKVDLAEILQNFVSLLERAGSNGFAYERSPVDIPGRKNPFLLVVSLDSCGDVFRRGICLVTEKISSQQFSEILVRAGLVADVPKDYYNFTSNTAPHQSVIPSVIDNILNDLIGVAHGVMSQPSFLMACSTLANEVAQKFACARVCIGWKKGGYIRLVTVSHLEDFQRDSQATEAVESLFEEVVDQETIVSIPALQPHFVVDRAHREFFARNVLSQIVSLPVYHSEQIKGVVSCELKEEGMNIQQIESLSLLLEIISPWLSELHYRDKWIGARALHRSGQLFGRLFNSDHITLKIASAVIVLMFFLSLLIKMDYRIEGVATLQTDMVRFVSAPFDGVVSEVSVKEGEHVKSGDKLVALDPKELQLKYSQESADIVRYTREADKSRAQNALADMKIAQSRVEELSSELARTKYHLGRAVMTAQSDGIVVEGDTKKLLGAPVSKGDVLMKVARIENMYASLKIRERDIDEIRQSLTGELVLVSHPEKIFQIRVEKLIPLAEIDQQEGNVFVVKALFNEKAPDWWRPGMSGLAKIDVGKRTIAWILTHRVVDFIRMYIWW